MPLSAAQVVTLAEMVGETPDAAQSALDGLPRVYDEDEVAAIEGALVADSAAYAEMNGKVHLELEGGRDGVNLKYGRRLEKLRRDNRKRLGFPLYAGDEVVEGAARFLTYRGPGWG